MLSDARIRYRLHRGDLKIDGLGRNAAPRPPSLWERALQPASVDVRLDRHFAFMKTDPHLMIDPRKDNTRLFDRVELESDDPGLVVPPGAFVLASTYERFALPDDLIGHVHGKSSIGRLGLQVHCTAGLLDPGWRGYITLELSNLTGLPWLLAPGMRIAQVTFDKVKGVARPYGHKGLGSHYQDQPRGPVLPKTHEGFEAGLPKPPARWANAEPLKVKSGESFTIDPTLMNVRLYSGPTW